MTAVRLEGDHAAPEAAIEEFAACGHTVVRALVTPAEVASVRPSIVDGTARRAWNRHIPPEDRDSYSKAFLQATNLWTVDASVRAFVHSPRCARVASELLQVDGVRLYHDQALVKEAHGGPTPWHQDQGYWPLDTDRTITLWMPLVDLPAEVGSMTFADGSHLLGDLRGPAISEESQLTFAELIEARGLSTRTHGALAGGDATFHAGWTLHAAGPNPTDDDRPVMTVIYVADGARVTAPSAQQELDLAMWAPGAAPGDLLATDLNPRLWPVDD